jgi:small subunit ribosomal protein S29
MPLVDLLEFGAEKTSYSPMCYSAAVDVLMNQDEKPFVMVLDEFNCYFEKGHYYHAEYDEDVKKPVPNDQISLFKPAMDAMAISMEEDEDGKPQAPYDETGAIATTTNAIPRKTIAQLHASSESSNEGQQSRCISAKFLDSLLSK